MELQGRQGKAPVSAACFRYNDAGWEERTGVLPDSGKGRRGGRVPFPDALAGYARGDAAGID